MDFKKLLSLSLIEYKPYILISISIYRKTKNKRGRRLWYCCSYLKVLLIAMCLGFVLTLVFYVVHRVLSSLTTISIQKIGLAAWSIVCLKMVDLWLYGHFRILSS